MSHYRRVDQDVQVEVDGLWLPGHLRAWDQRDGEWWGNVMWNAGPGDNRLDWFLAERIRRV
jgi:hypothetical protein